MNLRAAREADAEWIARLWNDMIRNTLATFTTDEKSVAEVATLIATRPGACWVAAQDGPVGFVTFGPFRGGPGYAATVEHTVIVDAGAQGGGVGKALIEKAVLEAAGQGYHIMVAAISSANPRAVAFHAALGFSQTAHMPEVGRKAGQWLDLILMQKTL